MKLYLGLAKPLLLYVYLPLAFIGLLAVIFKSKSSRTRLWAIPLYLFAAYAIPLGDVTWHSWHMAKVCPKAGLHIYRTVVVDGFMALTGGESYILKDGYSFVESKDFYNKGIVTRYEKTASGVRRLDGVPPISEWELVENLNQEIDKKPGVTISRSVIRNRQTGEVIADYYYYSAWRGWIDALIGSVIDNSVGGCYRRPKLTQKYQDILIPSGESK